MGCECSFRLLPRQLGLATVLLLFVLISWNLSIAAVHQQFESTPSNLEVNPGSVAKLTCKIRNRNGECFWLANSKPGGTSLSALSPIQGKYEFDRSPSNGDCSISVYNTSLLKDDGLWECQVSAGSLNGNMLNSEPVRLTVRQPPSPPTIEHHSTDVGNVVYRSGDGFVTIADIETVLHCISRKGNPPAKLLWFIDKDDITNKAMQSNDSDPDLEKTWRAKSELRHIFGKKDHGKTLKCVAKHDAYNTGSMDIIVSLNISYKPQITLEVNPKTELEEGQTLTLTCNAIANPPATIMWEKTGNQRFNFEKTIRFPSLKRTDSGVYSCSANNLVGDSEKETVTVDVKYKPKVLSIDPMSFTAELYQPLKLECEAEGNPKPSFTWLQSVNGQPNTWQHRGNDPVFNVANLTFDYQGKYICEVANTILGKEYKDQSRELDLDIVGPPQAIISPGHEKDKALVVEKSDDATISVIFCSDPKPLKMYWEWGSNKLDLGQSMARYISKHLTSDDLPQDCFDARLVLENVETSDSRKYTFHVQNEKGKLAFDVLLQVKEPVTVSAVVGIVVGCVVVLVMIVIVAFFLLRKEKCFIRGQGFHPESENSSRRLSEELQQNGGHSPKDRAIPPDALYTDVQNVQHYENLKPETRNSGDRNNGDGIVYANLDLPAMQAERGKKKTQKPVVPENIEYAEIQFKPTATSSSVDL